MRDVLSQGADELDAGESICTNVDQILTFIGITDETDKKKKS